MPFIATWINLEIITLSKLDKDKYHISVIYGIFKKDTNEFIYKRETQTQKNLWLLKEKEKRRGINQEAGICNLKKNALKQTAREIRTLKMLEH